jgi:hypothetical protein
VTKTDNVSSSVATSSDNEVANTKVSPCLQQITRLVDARRLVHCSLTRKAGLCWLQARTGT